MLLYIDPGTGSMLFSILIGVLGAGYYLVRTLVMKMKYSMSGGKKEKLNESRMKYVIFSDSKRYWNIFKPICEEMDRRGQDIVYYTLSEDDPALSCGLEHVKAEYLDGGNRAFSRLNFVNASVILSTTPSLGVPVRFAEISHYACMCEMAYSSHGLRPELSYGSHFFQDLVESGIFYTAIYQGEPGCEFNEEGFEAFPDRYAELTGDEKLKNVVKVYDLGEKGATLYAEVKSQDCLLGLL